MSVYTFRLLSSRPDLVVECCKWEDNTRPVVYRIYPQTSSCNCVATKRDCKHIRLLNDLIPDFINEMHLWSWNEKTGWTEVNDIPIKEFVDAVFAS